MATSTNRKRKRTLSLDDCPKPKRRNRRRPRSTRPQSKVFPDKDDLIQFQSIFHSIKYSPMVSDSSFSIPISIIQELAEYATGIVIDCASSKCDDKVVVLRNDGVYCHCGCFHGFHHKSYHDATESLSNGESDSFYCSSCALQLEWCEDCGHCVFLPECTKCSECTMAIFDCDCDNERCYEFECVICSSVLCGECGHWCTECGEIICSECWTNLKTKKKEEVEEEEEGVIAFQCDQCPQSVVLPHKGCNTKNAIESHDAFCYCAKKGCGNIVCLNCYCHETGKGIESMESIQGDGCFCDLHR